MIRIKIIDGPSTSKSLNLNKSLNPINFLIDQFGSQEGMRHVKHDEER